MDDLADVLLQQARAFSMLEVTAVVLAVAYLLLQIRQNIWCWLCAFVSSAIYVLLFIDAKLYMESGLYVFYVAMAVYGWMVWTRGERGGALPVSRWPLSIHIAAVLTIIGLSALFGTALSRYTQAAFPYVDSATTFAALWTTYLAARKVLENWWYWLVIDVVSIGIYWSRGLELTAVLFVLYVVMIPFGLLAWTRSYRLTQTVPSS